LGEACADLPLLTAGCGLARGGPSDVRRAGKLGVIEGARQRVSGGGGVVVVLVVRVWCVVGVVVGLRLVCGGCGLGVGVFGLGVLFLGVWVVGFLVVLVVVLVFWVGLVVVCGCVWVCCFGGCVGVVLVCGFWVCLSGWFFWLLGVCLCSVVWVVLGWMVGGCFWIAWVCV
ncbi:hypothetical protein RA276_27905, partial [Pseudomonas syringae pv. tagetis]